MSLRFYVNHVLTHETVGELDPFAYDFGEPLVDTGEANLTVALPPGLGANSLLHRIERNKFELVITDGDFDRGASVLWAGWIDKRTPDPAHAQITYHATHWRGWFYRREVPPGTFLKNLIRKDFYNIAYDLFEWAVNTAGAPNIVVPESTPSRPRRLGGEVQQLTVEPWASIGTLVDSVGKRDGGFEWSLGFRRSVETGQLEPFLEMWSHGEVRSSSILLSLDNTSTTNRIAVGLMPEDGTTVATRVYATSDGDTPVFAKDEDPNLDDGETLLLERHSTYQDNRNPKLLYSHARAERLARQNPFTEVPVSFTLDSPPVASFRTGDRARLIVKDGWRNLDQPGVRIVNKSVVKAQGGLPLVTVSLDMADVRVIA